MKSSPNTPTCTLCPGSGVDRLLRLKGTESPGARAVRELEQRRVPVLPASPDLGPLAELHARIARLRARFA